MKVIQKQNSLLSSGLYRAKRNILMRLVWVICGGFFGWMSGAQAQDTAANYPNRPIRIIVPFAAGGASDVLSRILGKNSLKAGGSLLLLRTRLVVMHR